MTRPGPYVAEPATDEDGRPMYCDDLCGYQWFVADGLTECCATCIAGPMLEADARALAGALNAAEPMLGELEALRAEVARLHLMATAGRMQP
jgi:hypothetical protein